MEVQCFTGGNFAQNGYVAWCEVTGQCVIVDPGAAALDMVAAVKAGAGDLTAILLTHAHLRRLEAEAIRDAMLQASGSLIRNPLGGSDAFNTNRRSLYVRVIRNNLDPFLTVFNTPVPGGGGEVVFVLGGA